MGGFLKIIDRVIIIVSLSFRDNISIANKDMYTVLNLYYTTPIYVNP